MEASTPRRADSRLSPNRLTPISDSLPGNDLKAKEEESNELLGSGSIQCATDLLVQLCRNECVSPLNSSDSSSLISIPFSDVVVDECIRNAAARNRSLVHEEIAAFSSEFRQAIEESRDPGKESLGPSDVSSVATMMAEDPKDILQRGQILAATRRSKEQHHHLIFDSVARSIDEFRVASQDERYDNYEEEGDDEDDDEEIGKNVAAETKPRKKIRPNVKVITKAVDEDLECYDTNSGLWRMLSAYDELTLSQPGHNAFRQEEEHWLQADVVPWRIMEESRNKCLEWFEKQEDEAGLDMERDEKHEMAAQGDETDAWKLGTNSRRTASTTPDAANFCAVPAKGSGCDRDAEEYNMSHPKRGVALIFNHQKFDRMASRSGSDKDCRDLSNQLSALGFEIRIREDLTLTELYKELYKTAREDHSEADCLLVVVMSHGETGYLHCRDKMYPTQDLWLSFAGDKCPTLVGKPKLFFIQACRGTMVDSGVSVDETDGYTMSYTIPTHADILIVSSTVEGHYSWRNPSKGSWFIQALCEELRINGRTRDLVTLLTFVNRRVAIDYQSVVPHDVYMDRKKQVSSVTSMLTRLVYFDQTRRH